MSERHPSLFEGGPRGTSAESSELPITFITVGNRYRRDDGVGYEITKRLRAENLPQAEFIETSGEGAALLDMLIGRRHVFLFDAVCSGAPPGTIFRFEAHHQSLPSKFFNYSTHAFSVAEAVELGRILNQLPEYLVIYGVEGQDFDAGAGLSKEVQPTVETIVSKVLVELHSLKL